jgi:hypothetical protein
MPIYVNGMPDISWTQRHKLRERNAQQNSETMEQPREKIPRLIVKNKIQEEYTNMLQYRSRHLLWYILWQIYSYLQNVENLGSNMPQIYLSAWSKRDQNYIPKN